MYKTIGRPQALSLVERSIIHCPYLGGSTIGGYTVVHHEHGMVSADCSLVGNIINLCAHNILIYNNMLI